MNIADQLRAAATAHARKLTAQLRRESYEAGWPASVARSLTVNSEDGDFSVGYPESIEDDVLNNEMGTQDSPHKATILPFFNRLDDKSGDFDSVLAKILSQFEVIV